MRRIMCCQKFMHRGSYTLENHASQKNHALWKIMHREFWIYARREDFMPRQIYISREGFIPRWIYASREESMPHWNFYTARRFYASLKVMHRKKIHDSQKFMYRRKIFMPRKRTYTDEERAIFIHRPRHASFIFFDEKINIRKSIKDSNKRDINIASAFIYLF